MLKNCDRSSKVQFSKISVASCTDYSGCDCYRLEGVHIIYRTRSNFSLRSNKLEWFCTCRTLHSVNNYSSRYIANNLAELESGSARLTDD